MSENLKRAESLFNRIMNQNKPQASSGAVTESNLRGYKSSGSSSFSNTHGSHNGNTLWSHNGETHGRSHHSNGNSNGHSNGHSHHRYNNRSYNKHSTHNAAAVAAVAADLPKRDPVKEARDAVAGLTPDENVLLYCWTIWHHSRTRMKTAGEENAPNGSSPSQEGVESAEAKQQPTAVALDSYLQTATEIEFPRFGLPGETVKPIASLEQMWLSMSFLKKQHDLFNGSELLIFKTGVNPVWEDPINAKGGRWVFRFSLRTYLSSSYQEIQDNVSKGRRRATLVWERLVLKTLTGCLISGRKDSQDALLNDIAGLVLSIRRDEVIISLWNSNLHFSKKKDDEDKKGLSGFHARRAYCDAILRVIREVDLITQGSDCIETQSSASNERVPGVGFEYRLHSDNSLTYTSNERPRRGKNNHHHHSQTQPKEEVLANGVSA